LTTLPRGIRVTLAAVLVAGAVGTYYLGVRPVLRFRSAEGWLARPCQVISSGVRTTYDEGLRKDSIDLAYRYEVEGEAFTSDAYDLFSGSSSGCNDDRELAKRLPVGSTVECYVNPRHPREAVLNRRLPPETASAAVPMILAALAALPFVVHRRRRGEEPGGVAGERGVPVDTMALSAGDHASAKLTLVESRRVKWLALILVAVLFAVVWSIVSRIVGEVAAALVAPTDASNVAQTAVRAGLGVALAWTPMRMALRMLNPYLELSVSPAVARFGETVRLEWRLRGRRARVSSLRIWLDGHDGPPKMKRAKPFHRHPLLDVGGGAVSQTGQVQLTIPEPQPSWPPADRATWNVWVELRAAPLPRAINIYKIDLARRT
jgi:hypothetical protein